MHSLEASVNDRHACTRLHMQWFSIISLAFKAIQDPTPDCHLTSHFLTLSGPLMPPTLQLHEYIAGSHISCQCTPFVCHVPSLLLHLLYSYFKIQFQYHFISLPSPCGLPRCLDPSVLPQHSEFIPVTIPFTEYFKPALLFQIYD